MFKKNVQTEGQNFFRKLRDILCFYMILATEQVCLGPETESQATVKLLCPKIGPPGTHMCRLKHAAALEFFQRTAHA